MIILAQLSVIAASAWNVTDDYSVTSLSIPSAGPTIWQSLIRVTLQMIKAIKFKTATDEENEVIRYKFFAALTSFVNELSD